MKKCTQEFSEILHQRHDQIKLHDFLKFSMPTISNESIDKIILNDQCFVDGVPTNDNECLQAGQTINWVIYDYHEQDVDCSWKLLWQNSEIIAVHKPANLPVHKTTRNVVNTLMKLVQRESEFNDAHLLHRLDLETSGIVLMAKSNEKAQYWQPKLASLMLKKTYRAIVYSKPNWTQKEYSCFLNTKIDSEIRCQMYVQESGKLSETHFKVLESNENYSLIECELITGRKHQIRAQLSQLGHPIVGDKIYSNNGEYYLKRLKDQTDQSDEEKLQCTHHLLMAYKVVLQELDGNKVTIKDGNYSKQWTKFCLDQNFKL